MLAFYFKLHHVTQAFCRSASRRAKLFGHIPYFEMGGGRIMAGKIELSVKDETEALKEFSFLHSDINIGRSEDNNIVVPDVKVSRHHAEIRYEQNVYVLYDLESTNGTWLDDKKIDAAILPRKGRIGVGDTQIVFKIDFEAGKEPDVT